jgi:tRNA(Glu) U13 pseudouridine synthase TruD
MSANTRKRIQGVIKVDNEAKLSAKKLEDVPEDKRFLCQDGRELKNLQDLAVALREMTDETFGAHVNQSKNDFANWIRDVVGDEGLSKALQETKNRDELSERLTSRISQLKSETVLREVVWGSEWFPGLRPPRRPFG